MTKMSDEQLFLSVKQDCRTAFDELYDRYWYNLFNIAYKRLRDKEAAGDIVQDIFTDLWNKRSEKNIGNLSAYLSTAVRYKVYSLLAEKKAGIHFVQPFESMVSPSTADATFNEKEIKHLLALWMETLPEKRREIFRLRYCEGASTGEISKHLSVSQKTVQNQLLLAFRDLRAQIAHYLAAALVVFFLIDWFL